MKIIVSINVEFIDKVDLEVVPLDVCGVMFEIRYMYIQDEIFMSEANQY